MGSNDLAIELRKTKKAESERESVRWLSLADNQGDARARFNLTAPIGARLSARVLQNRQI